MTSSRWFKISAIYAAFWLANSVVVPVSAQNATPRITVQGAQQSNYSRVVFDVPVGTEYRVVRTGNKIRMVVTGTFRPDFSALRGQDLVRIGNPTSTRSGGNTTISFDVLPGISPRDFRSGKFVILDIYGGNAGAVLPARAARGNPPAVTTAQTSPQTANAAANTPEASGENTGTETTNTDAENATNTVTTEVDSAEDGQTAGDEQDGAASVANSTTESVQAVNTDIDPEPIVELSKPEPQPVVATVPAATGSNVRDVATLAREVNPDIEFVGIEEIAEDEAFVSAVVSEVDNGIAMNFAVPESVAAAVFERGGMLWVVFDQPFKFDPTGLAESGDLFSSRVRRVEQRPHADALVLRMSIRANQSLVVERDQNNWLVYLKDTPAKPRFPLKPVRREEGGRGQQVYVSATEIGRKIEVEDPDVGDQIIIIPMGRQGHGLAESYSYAAAELLESAQGVIVTPLTDFVDVERFRDGISIRTTGNDILSATRLSRATGIGDDVHAGFSRLIDFANWRIGEVWEYRKNKARLFYELSLQNPGERNDVRWKLARYYLAHGRAAECLGILERILVEDPLLVQNSEFLAVRGVANFKQGRLEDALADLSARELEAEQDADLWRTLVEEALGNNEQSLKHYRLGRDVMGTYDVKDRAEIQLAVIRAAIGTSNLELAQQELDLLNGLELSERQLSESIYQSARISEMQGQSVVAYAQYVDLSDAKERWIAARARYSLVNFGVKNGDLTAEDAIDQLERLRYAWRGDRFEIQLLDDLADYYFETKQYEAGLESLRQGSSYYPELAKDRRMVLRSAQTFRNLFLEDGADNMSPITAISLFYKFRELTPLGNDGDQMIRRLADRLVSVDLLRRAAELLEYQVKVRSEGAARAQIAANLAKIYILDDRAEAAIDIMRATREPRLPDDIQRNRRHVEARALVEQMKFEEAEVLLESDRSIAAEILRTDIFWGAKSWQQLTTSIRRLQGDGWRRNEALTALQRLNLIRLSIAMTFAEDRAGLIEMRRRYGNQMISGDFANAFEMLTNDQELTGREIGAIASQIAGVEKLQSFMRGYRNDFSGR